MSGVEFTVIVGLEVLILFAVLGSRSGGSIVVDYGPRDRSTFGPILDDLIDRANREGIDFGGTLYDNALRYEKAIEVDGEEERTSIDCEGLPR